MMKIHLTCCHVQHTQVTLQHIQAKDELWPVTLFQDCDAAGSEVTSNLQQQQGRQCMAVCRSYAKNWCVSIKHETNKSGTVAETHWPNIMYPSRCLHLENMPLFLDL